MRTMFICALMFSVSYLGCASKSLSQCENWAIPSSFSAQEATWMQEGATLWNQAAEKEVFKIVREDNRESCTFVRSDESHPDHGGEFVRDENRIILYTENDTSPNLDIAEMRWKAITAHEIGHVLLGPQHLSAPALMQAEFDVMDFPGGIQLQPNDLSWCRAKGICP